MNFYLHIWIASVALCVNGGEIFALLHVNLQRALLVIVLHSKLDVASNLYRSITTLAGS